MWTVVHCLIHHETGGKWTTSSLVIERETLWEALARLSQYLEENADGVQFDQSTPLETAQLAELTVTTWTSRSAYEGCTKEKRTSLLTTRLSALFAPSFGSFSLKPGTQTGLFGSSPN